MRRLSRSLAIIVTGFSSACAPSRGAAPAPQALGTLVVAGIPQELAEHRAATLSNVFYDLALDLNDPRWINGTVTIYVDRTADARHLVLDFRGLSVTELHANRTKIEDAAWVNEHIVVPEHHLVEGTNVVDVRFASNVAPSGASVIRFTEDEGDTSSVEGPDGYYYSLLVPSDASQLFPSFDQPDLKAAFRIEVVVPPGATALSNAAAADSADLIGGRWFRFESTQPISTYLAAVAAGPWAVWHDSTGRVPMRLLARRSRAPEVDAETLLATNRRALEWLEGYFDYDYPFGKLDLLLAPAFPFGGMEHPGAIFYNESRFIFREPPTEPQRLARDATIYHEIAHQWFGDLVTMRWFDDLWLKEGFSTFMAARMQEELDPGTDAWKTFYLQNKPSAYRVEVTRGTTPVWQALPNLALAKSNYGPIVYNKAPSILRQLQFLVGEAAFRTGLRRLLREHAFATITWRDLLGEMERASGTELSHFGAQYILRAGAPVIETRLTTRDGLIEELALVQRPSVESADTVGEDWWPGRVLVRLAYDAGEDAAIPVALTGPTTVVEEARGRPAPDFVFPNDGDYGYGIFLLDEASAGAILERAGELEDPLLRTLAWGALWDLLREGRLAPSAFVDAVLRDLPRERDEQIATFLLGRAAVALDRYLAEGEEETRRRAFEEMLAAGIDEAGAPYGLRKARLDAMLSAARSPEALQLLEEMLAGRRLFQGEPLPQPSRWAAVRTLVAMGHADADSLLAAERARDASPEGDRQAFIAGAARPTAASKAEYFSRYLDDATLNEEWVTASLPAFHHPAHAEITLPHLQPALERLPWIRENRRIFFLPQWVESFIGGQQGAEALSVVDAYLAANPDLPEDIRRKVLQARDELARTVEIRSAGGG